LGGWDYAPRMNEPTGFEARAVLAPRRRRLARLALLLPVVALVAIAAAGFSGARSDQATARIPGPTAVAAPSRTVAGSTPAIAPAQVIGLHVHRLDEVQMRSLGRDDVVAVVGWYVATAITDCPPIAAIYRQGSLPDVRGDADTAAFCVRTGVLYASQRDVQDRWSGSAGLPAVGVTIVVGVIVPPGLEMIGADATEVVVVGRFVESGAGCPVPAGCPRELVVDHVAWTPRA
jgi:hypothetical protein